MLNIILPTLNEAAAIGGAIHHVRAVADAPVRVIVSDCLSHDATQSIARAAGACVVSGGSCRAAAMNLGAAAVEGDNANLLFLHADTRLPPDFDLAVDQTLHRPGIVGGAFDLQFSAHPLNHGINRRLLQAVCLLNRIRYRTTRGYFGDQAIFCSARTFRTAGGFDAMPLLEDLYFSRKLNRLGRTVLLGPPAKTSPRRFVQVGVLRQGLCDLHLLTMERLGLVGPGSIARYNAFNRRIPFDASTIDRRV